MTDGQQTPFARCCAAKDLRSACTGLIDDLHERWDLPSVYLLIDGRLRCQASRGYFQVSDGFLISDGVTPGVGVIARVVATGQREVISDVTADPSFIAAIPGLQSEICIPIRAYGTVVGAVNLESRTTLDDTAVEELERAAFVLGARLEALGGIPEPSLAEKLGRIGITMAGLTDGDAVARLAVRSAREVSGMSTAGLVLRQGQGWAAPHLAGPLSGAIASWGAGDLEILSGWVSAGTSSYFPDGEDVPPGFEFLSDSIEALSLQPLVVAGKVLGMLVTADERAAAHDPVLTGALEMLASQTAATLSTVRTLGALAVQALQDPLTGLGNRRVLVEALDVAGAGEALVLLDLDGFKGINDAHGHAAGDALLQAVAHRLAGAVGATDLVCRLGGDEFAVLGRGLGSEEQVERLAGRLLGAIASPSGTSVGASAGVRILDGGTASAALVDADAALYAAKRSGRGSYVLWNECLRQAATEDAELIEDFRAGLLAGELRMVYQPILDIATGQVRGVEALARWEHPERGTISPDVFVAAAERRGAVAELTTWSLQNVCRTATAWPDWLEIGVNVSAAQLTSDAVVDDVRHALQVTGLRPGRLVVEVTETSALSDLPRAKRTLMALSELGVKLALDDFGTGQSSLTHAHTLPFDVLKIDRSFVTGAAGGDKRAIATIAAVAALGQRLTVDIVAEGVEDIAVLPALAALGCGLAQGFALSRPLEATDVLDFLEPGDVPTVLPPPCSPVRLVAAH